ncbi:hypothetical protein [Pseudoduganella albidiflava]|uniref:SnoaL-like domain-containing protein n=1 Tax=Pseudoduganella albidiflava TaxID=321983 RepID=A0ABX5RTV7_9BURK|nr:hypothetical protein [Pseudoduganella albidiflava]QBI01309.1 hypothetical protein EYF70_10985 [Pseudoduganella albidiflava]
MNITANKNLVKRFLSHFQKGGVNEILDMMSDDATWWVNGKPNRPLFPDCARKQKCGPYSTISLPFSTAGSQCS